jgi:hypothetical protein
MARLQVNRSPRMWISLLPRGSDAGVSRSCLAALPPLQYELHVFSFHSILMYDLELLRQVRLIFEPDRWL